MSKRAKPKRILVTGFGPFPGQTHNPSADVVQALAKRSSKTNYMLRCVILKTEYAAGFETLRREIQNFQPDIVINFGVAAKRKTINLETIAHNRIRPGRADASGFKPTKSTIDKGSKTLVGTLPMHIIRKHLAKAGIPARISKTAGDYLCNFIFYHALRIAKTQKHGVFAGFIHIPVPGGASSITKKQLLRAAEVIIAAASHEIFD